ncbi:MAG: branched-chain amino acid ABC transporter permease [Actinobacteria bacterium]|jgi:branched-chain amino acid transport system permease protein|nr:branched-chain amino acid ABC transporter permease [Actinomycetota bacterium]MCL6095614.1 branched-chain amino acid ABC transporter permease [Actinomycetota bacterium]
MSTVTAPAATRRYPLNAYGLAPKLLITVVIIVAAVIFSQVGPAAYVYDADVALLAAIGAIGLNLLTGYAGQISVGNAAFLAIGAYTVVFLHANLPFPWPILIGAAAAAIVGFAIGLPSLRLGGLYLIFSTLALQFVVEFATNQYDTSTGAIAGHFIPSPKLGPWLLSSDRVWFITFLVVLVLVALFTWNIVRGQPGRAYAALRRNEAAAAVMGINVTGTKLMAFAISSAIVGLAGGLGAYFIQEVSSGYYSLTLAISYVAMVLIGGLASIWGSIIGAFVVTMIPFIMQATASSIGGASQGGFFEKNLSSIDTAIYGLAILIFLFFRPEGIASLAKLKRNQMEVNKAALAKSWSGGTK